MTRHDFDPDFPATAATRFGYGLSPRFAPPPDPDAVLASLSGPDHGIMAWPSVRPGEAAKIMREYGAARQQRKRDRDAYRDIRNTVRDLRCKGVAARFARILDAPIPFRERIHWFWTDHFTTIDNRVQASVLQFDHHDLAIRPHICGRFDDLLQAAIMHPEMLYYLNQNRSVGPSSVVGRRKGKGLNENLAREVMELHTLGVESTYSQDDVRQMALLFTGMTSRQSELAFNAKAAEPGAETVLGRSYGGDRASLDDVRAVLRDLARHPDTAEHIARKLAVHFVADDPDPDLVAQMARAYADAETELLPVYRTMLLHPASHSNPGGKARQPFDWMATALRGMGMTGEAMAAMNRHELREYILDPLSRMGQPWQSPVGPDGWPEKAEAWLTPPGLAERITWSMTVPARMMKDLPDPRTLARTIIPGLRGEEVADIARRAERRSDGLALVLASPALNTR